MRFALQSARLASEIRQPTERGIQVFEKTVEQELIMLEQDEKTRVSGASLNVVREAPAGKPCHFFNKPGGCTRNPCPYAHAAKEDAKSQKPENQTRLNGSSRIILKRESHLRRKGMAGVN